MNSILPNSNLLFRHHVDYRLNTDGYSDELYGTAPDILVADNEDILDRCSKKFNFTRKMAMSLS